jgi:hypothetical protein
MEYIEREIPHMVHLFDRRTSSENYQGICW